MPDDAFSAAQLAQLRQVFREELGAAGLRLDGADHIDEAREDFRFIRKLRKSWEGAATKVGTWVLIGFLAIIGTIMSLGFWSWISHGGK